MRDEKRVEDTPATVSPPKSTGGKLSDTLFTVILIVFSGLVVVAAYFLIAHRPAPIFEQYTAPEAASSNRAGAAKGVAPAVITFGFDLRSSPEEDARQYLPFLRYLENATGYTFKLRFTPKDGQITDDLGTGKIQLAAIGAVSYLKAIRSYPVIPLVRGLNRFDKAAYQSVIIARTDSAIDAIESLKGRTLAFGSRTSTQGYVIPRILLAENNIKLEGLKEHFFTGSHRNCANAVISGKADACGMQDTMGKDLERSGLVRIVHTSRFYPSSGIVASATLPAPVREAIRKALIAFKPKGAHSEGLHGWAHTEMPNGFTAAKKSDYDGLRRSMSSLGLL